MNVPADEIPGGAAAQRCRECGEEFDPRFTKEGYCFVCSVHALSCCADELPGDQGRSPKCPSAQDTAQETR